MFNAAETECCRRLVKLALDEDLGVDGDVTSRRLIPDSTQGQGVVLARADGVVSGLSAAAMVFVAVDPRLEFAPCVTDGSLVPAGCRLATVRGPTRGILAGERTALNFLQRLSGIATLTRRFVDAVKGLPAVILDTRKTTPGWRLLEKYAVRCGGGNNHRMGLYDAVLIKDNHLATLGGDLKLAMDRVRQDKDTRQLEIEVDRRDQLDAILPLQPDVVLLDNMKADQLRGAVRSRNRLAPKVQLEASGGITLENVRSIAETGVDRISIGALTHSAGALDIALDFGP